jgi:hypothetical protein
MALKYYLDTYGGTFGMFLRNKDPQNLEEAQVVALKLEKKIPCNLSVSSNPCSRRTLKVIPFDDLQPSVVSRAQEFLDIEE